MFFSLGIQSTEYPKKEYICFSFNTEKRSTDWIKIFIILVMNPVADWVRVFIASFMMKTEIKLLQDSLGFPENEFAPDDLFCLFDPSLYFQSRGSSKDKQTMQVFVALNIVNARTS